ncbi:radial spoke head protein 9 homolog isoform X2 [Schistocerca cancellata]|uniref:radial spoke head protein 9 homolog isoform X2 n=1 Tax=Schistocerca cancellata TaxID=274614 RepID=UPI0021177BE8|nr:radial spoke head protein 9 homolog isoform X2 [Schistocerca cancellata]
MIWPKQKTNLEVKAAEAGQTDTPMAATICNEGLVAPLKEEDRLSATVWAVTEAAAVVPRGVFVVNSDDGCLSWNPCFVGLGHSKAVSLSHYLHLRPPRKPWNTCLLTAPSPNPAIDCLDSVDTDFPPGCWSLQLECGSHVVVLRNLLWPGAVGYHAVGTPDHGYVYIGSGKRNLDLPFMV